VGDILYDKCEFCAKVTNAATPKAAVVNMMKLALKREALVVVVLSLQGIDLDCTPRCQINRKVPESIVCEY
jgi:hypothetical protein